MKFLLDTSSLVNFFRKKKNDSLIENLLSKAEKKRIDLMISSITISEIFYILSRIKSKDFALAVIKYIKISPLKIIPVDVEVAEIGGKMKFKYGNKLPIADALIAATSLKEGSSIITEDKHFKMIKEIDLKI